VLVRIILPSERLSSIIVGLKVTTFIISSQLKSTMPVRRTNGDFFLIFMGMRSNIF
jgi:hypothetical protein